VKNTQTAQVAQLRRTQLQQCDSQVVLYPFLIKPHLRSSENRISDKTGLQVSLEALGQAKQTIPKMNRKS